MIPGSISSKTYSVVTRWWGPTVEGVTGSGFGLENVGQTPEKPAQNKPRCKGEHPLNISVRYCPIAYVQSFWPNPPGPC
jgi:hypothetical protein